MPKSLYIKGTDKLVTRLTDAQFEHLTNLLQEESPTDRDYYIDETSLAYLAEKGADHALVAALRQALGAPGGSDEHFSSGASTAQEGIDVVWREE